MRTLRYLVRIVGTNITHRSGKPHQSSKLYRSIAIVGLSLAMEQAVTGPWKELDAGTSWLQLDSMPALSQQLAWN